MCDFSDAERLGFIQAVIEFFQEDPDNDATVDELRKTAESEYRGCRIHYTRGVLRVAKISRIIPPSHRKDFERDALGLVNLSDSDAFIEACEDLIMEYPGIESWIKWWMAPEHAQMLFTSQLAMDPALADRLPDSTNAEESMHYRLYVGCNGKKFDTLTGFMALKFFCEFLHTEYQHRLSKYSLLH